MENTNKNFNNTMDNETMIQSVQTIAHAIINTLRMECGVNHTQINKLFGEFVELKATIESDDVKRSINKLFWACFNNREAALVKNLTKFGSIAATGTADKNRAVANVLTKPLSEQKRAVRNMLSATLKKGAFELYYNKKSYMTAYDAMTDEEFSTLYRGAGLIRVENVIQYLARVIKNNNK